MPIRFIAVVLLALLAAPATAWAGEAFGDKPVRLLEDHDFAAGGYSVAGLFWRRQSHPIQDALGEFYVDDPALLEKLKAQWVTSGPAPMYACGYHYRMLVIRDQRVIDSFLINLETECGTVVTGAGSYHFDAALLTRHADRYRKPVVEQREFASLADAREYLASLTGNERLLLMPQPRWRDYDGEFRFMLPCPDHGYDEARVNGCIGGLRAEINAKYPGETFDLSEAGGSGDDLIMIEMKSSRALHEHFNLYDDHWKWRDYDPALTLYWKQVD